MTGKALTRKQILDRINVLVPRKTKFFTKDEIRQRIRLSRDLGLFAFSSVGRKYALRG